MVKANDESPENRSAELTPRADPIAPDPTDLLPSRFIPVSSVGAYDQGPTRGAPGARVAPSGRTLLNVAGTELVLTVSGNPQNIKNAGAHLGADPKTKEVAGRLVFGTHPKITPVRYHEKERTMTLYLNDIFRDHPQLRPTSEKWVTVSRSTEDGKSVFLIQLNLALRVSKSPKAGGEGAPTGQAALTKTRKTSTKQPQQGDATPAPESEGEVQA